MSRPILFAACFALLVSLSHAQDQAAKVPTFKELCEQRDAATTKLEELQQSYRAASAEDRVKIEEEFQKIATDLRQRILGEIEGQLPEQLKTNAADPQVLEASEIAMQVSFGQNRYATTLQLADLLLAADAKNTLAANFSGVCRFADNDFDGALKQLKAAEAAGLLIPDLGGRYLADAEKYTEYWKTEAPLREKSETVTDEAKQLPIVEFKTTRGDVVIELFEDEAPNTVANFISLIEKKYYDGLKFHRVIPDFMAQGGCPNTREGAVGMPGTGGPGYAIKCECARPDARMHFAGALSMAHAGKDTGGSQFFLTHLPTPHLNGVHTVFGRVTKGLDVVRAMQVNDQIVEAKVVRKRAHEYKPETIASRR